MYSFFFGITMAKEKFKKYKIRKPSENNIDDDTGLVPDKNGIIHLDEIPDPQFDMKYFQYNEKDVKKTEQVIRSSYEFRGLFQFIKTNLNINHCSFYEGYSMQNGLTIELHHAPFTLFDITEAVIAKSVHEKGYWETFRVVEEVNRLHYEFKVGLTPLNPTAHKLVHSGVLPIHPKIVIGDWKAFYSLYQAFLNETAKKSYDDMLALEEDKNSNPSIPKIMEYSPTRIESPIKLIDMSTIDKLIVDSKLKKLEEFTAKD